MPCFRTSVFAFDAETADVVAVLLRRGASVPMGTAVAMTSSSVVDGLLTLRLVVFMEPVIALEEHFMAVFESDDYSAAPLH